MIEKFSEVIHLQQKRAETEIFISCFAVPSEAMKETVSVDVFFPKTLLVLEGLFKRGLMSEWVKARAEELNL